jgi:putative transposase
MYPSDLTKRQWKAIEHYFERPDPRGARSVHSKYAIMNAILYVLRGGIPWRMMPNDLPPWKTVYDHYRRLCERGLWEQILEDLNKKARISVGKKALPSYALIDSQSTKTQYRGDEKGYDGGKKKKMKKETHNN